MALTWGALEGRAADTATIPLTTPKTSVSAAWVESTLTAAHRAQELGLPTTAIDLYQQVLDQPNVDQAAITLDLATALLDAGRAQEAERILRALPDPHGLEWRLRIGLAAAQQKRFDVAADEVNHINVDKLARPDRAWFWFLQGAIADTASPRDVPKANNFYQLAERDAPSDLARATILAAGLRVRLTLVDYKKEDLEPTRKLYESEQDKGRGGYQFAEDYAVMRDATGGKSEAVQFLSKVLMRVPRSEHEWTDRFRRLLGMIGDRARGGAGRNALNQLLETGTSADLQRQALQLLGRDSQHEPERGLFRAELDKVIAATPKSPILDALLLMRAQVALGDQPKDYVTAERRANELKDSFPGSPLRSHAFAVLAASAWEQHRYRLAADDARQSREALAALPAANSPTEVKVVAEASAELRVLEAEAWFRAGLLANSPSDFRNAAEAYAVALREPPAGVAAGDLMFQQALAEIRADANDPTKDLEKVIDTLEADSRFDSANRWEAEWNLVRVLRVQGKTGAALARVSRLLNANPVPGSPVIAPDLRAKMSWLQARLSFDTNHPEQTLALVAKLDAATSGIDPSLRAEIQSTAVLLKAQAQFKLGGEKDALATLDKLRTDFPKSEAAIYSYLVTATYYAEPGRDQIQKAQQSLGALIDNPEYRNSQYVPYAQFQWALLSERLGQEKDLRDADAKIEDLVKRNPPAPPELIFAARLKQGDLLRLLNDFSNAQVAYEALVNNPTFAQRPDIEIAQLRLAECLNAQSSTDPSGSNADRAQSMFEELLYRVSAPDDVRVEAGYNLGELLERRGQHEKARDVWWRDVVTPFLVEQKQPPPSGAKRGYWLARMLLDFGALQERNGNIDEARRAYVLLRDSKLGYGESMAAEQLQRLGIGNPAVATTAKP